MLNNLTRRTLMKGMAATGLATTLSGRAALAADEPLGITLVIPSPVGDVGWGHALAAGLEPVKAAYGDKVKVTVIENIPEGPDADRIMNKTVADGNKFLIAGSFGYQNGALQIARRSGQPVFLMGIAASPATQMQRTWDKVMWAAPFGRGAVVWEGPLFVPADADEAAIAALVDHWSARLSAATRRAEALVSLP